MFVDFVTVKSRQSSPAKRYDDDDDDDDNDEAYTRRVMTVGTPDDSQGGGKSPSPNGILVGRKIAFSGFL